MSALKLAEIDRAIESLEKGRFSMAACERLAVLYVVRDRLSAGERSRKGVAHDVHP